MTELSLHPVLAAFVARDADGVVASLAPDVVFHSPVADYRGLDEVAVVVRALVEVVTEAEVVTLLGAPGDVAGFLRGAVAGRPVDGVLRAVGPAEGPVAELTLMIRPLDALLAGVEQMRRALPGG